MFKLSNVNCKPPHDSYFRYSKAWLSTKVSTFFPYVVYCVLMFMGTCRGNLSQSISGSVATSVAASILQVSYTVSYILPHVALIFCGTIVSKCFVCMKYFTPTRPHDPVSPGRRLPWRHRWALMLPLSLILLGSGCEPSSPGAGTSNAASATSSGSSRLDDTADAGHPAPNGAPAADGPETPDGATTTSPPLQATGAQDDGEVLPADPPDGPGGADTTGTPGAPAATGAAGEHPASQQASAASGRPAPMPAAEAARAEKLLTSHHCLACHRRDSKVVGPAFVDVGARYHGQPGAEAMLAERILKGGRGHWGPVSMPPQPQLDDDTLRGMTRWILQLPDRAEPR